MTKMPYYYQLNYYDPKLKTFFNSLMDEKNVIFERKIDVDFGGQSIDNAKFFNYRNGSLLFVGHNIYRKADYTQYGTKYRFSIYFIVDNIVKDKWDVGDFSTFIPNDIILVGDQIFVTNKTDNNFMICDLVKRTHRLKNIMFSFSSISSVAISEGGEHLFKGLFRSGDMYNLTKNVYIKFYIEDCLYAPGFVGKNLFLLHSDHFSVAKYPDYLMRSCRIPTKQESYNLVYKSFHFHFQG